MCAAILPEEERFARNAVIMAQLVHESILHLNRAGFDTINPSIVGMASTIIAGIEKHSLITGFIEASHDKCWDRIKHRDERFFIENASDIFKVLPMDKVNLFRDLFMATDKNGKSIISDDLKMQLWDLFDSQVKISIKYVHKGRNPYSYSNGSSISNAYGRSFLDEVNMAHHAPTWNLELDFPLKY